VNVFGRLAFRVGLEFVRSLNPIRLMLLTGWLAGCSGSNSLPTTPLPPESWNDLKQKIATLRGLPFKRDVSLTTESSNATLAVPEAYATEEYGAQSLAAISRVYKRLGLLLESTDFAAALADYAMLERIFYYEARQGLAVITPAAAQLARALTADPGRRPERIPLVLALTRALQEQHFHWPERLRRVSDEDRKLAFRALSAGDALLVTSAYLRESQPTANSPDTLQTMARWSTALDKRASHLPDVLRCKLVFPYRQGSRFVQWAYTAKAWPGVNALFADPPLSTSQILYPEKYYSKRENPLYLSSGGLARQMKENPIVDQTLGAYLIQFLLPANLSRQAVAQIAAAWTGDQLSAYPEGENFLTAWISAWRNEDDARLFYQAYQTVLERRHRLRFTAPAGLHDTLLAEVTGKGSMLLQLKGPFVLLLDGSSTARTRQLAEDIWQSLDAATEPTIIPFDSATAHFHWSLKSR
jgi:hypothetical protein